MRPALRVLLALLCPSSPLVVASSAVALAVSSVQLVAMCSAGDVVECLVLAALVMNLAVASWLGYDLVIRP